MVIRKISIGTILSIVIGISMLTPAFSLSKSSTNDLNQGSRVVIVSLPRLSWESLTAVRTPQIDKLIKVGSIANLSIRTPGNKRLMEQGYSTISAGNRTSAVPSQQSSFFHPSEKYRGQLSKDTFLSERGIFEPHAAGLSLGFELTSKHKDNIASSSRVGAFAQALQDHNRSIAVFGNSDYCLRNEKRCINRSVGYVGVNEEGILENGNISRELLNSQGNIDTEKFQQEVIQSVERNDVTVAECSDLERLDASAQTMPESIANQHFQETIRRCDELVGDIVSKLDLRRDQIFIISPMSRSSDEELTVFIAAGNDIKQGLATSGITRREGIVALSDIAPTILTFFGIKPPDSMVNTLIDYPASTRTVSSRIQELINVNSGARIRDTSFIAVSIVFILSVFICCITAIVSYKTKRFRFITKLIALYSIAMPTVAFLMLPLMIKLHSPIMVVGFFVCASLAIGILGYSLGEKIGYKIVLLSVALFNIALQCVDIFFGGYFQLNSLFGYSALVAGRFAGYGNLTFSIISISAVIAVAILKQIALDRTVNQDKVNILLSLSLVIILIIIGIPYLGSDVGGVLALTPTIFIMILMIYEKKLNMRTIVYATMITLLTISIFSIFDLTRPVSQRTHLGRFVQLLMNGGAGAIIERKIESNIMIFSNALIASIIIILTIFLLILFLKPESFISRHRTQYPIFAYIAYPGTILALLGMFLNDSGVAIPGMMLAIAIPTLSLLAYEIDGKIDTTRHDA